MFNKILLFLCLSLFLPAGVCAQDVKVTAQELTQIAMEEMREREADYHYLHGVKFYRKGKWTQALLQLQKASELNPQHQGAKKYLEKVTSILCRQEQKRRQKEKEKVFVGYYKRGRAHFARGQFHEALSCFKRCQELQPSRSVRGWLKKAQREADTIPPPEPVLPPQVKVEVETIEEEEIPPSEEDVWKEKRVSSIVFKDTPVVEALHALSSTYGLNIVPRDDIKGKITIDLEDVTLDEALRSILKSGEYRYVKKGNIIFVEKEGVTTRAFSLNYARAQELKELFEGLLTEQGIVQVDERSNKLVVTDIPLGLEKAQDLLAQIDIPARQVMIEAKMVNITLSDLTQIGVNWSGTYSEKSSFPRDPRKKFQVEGGAFFAWPTLAEKEGTKVLPTGDHSIEFGGKGVKFPGLVFGVGMTLKHWKDVLVMIDALVEDQKADVLASPRIVTANGKEAKIIIGEKVPYKEKTQTTTGTTETTKFIDVGTILRVTPHIGGGGYITMTIHPEVSLVTGLIDSQPRIDTCESHTEVTIKDGRTIVIGGLIKETKQTAESRIPILGSLPLIGRLFRSTKTLGEKKELVVFVTPHILEY